MQNLVALDHTYHRWMNPHLPEEWINCTKALIDKISQAKNKNDLKLLKRTVELFKSSMSRDNIESSNTPHALYNWVVRHSKVHSSKTQTAIKQLKIDLSNLDFGNEQSQMIDMLDDLQVAVSDEQGMPQSLIQAVEKGDKSVVRKMIVAKADIDGKNEQGDAAVNLALYNGDIEIVEMLIEAGANVNLMSSDGVFPLHSAVLLKQVELTKKLLKSNAKVNCKDINGDTPLIIAVTGQQIEVAALLLHYGAEINSVNNINFSALHLAAGLNNISLLNLLIEKGADVNLMTSNTPLHQAAASGHVKMVKILLKKGAYKNQRDNNGNTPLFYAVSNNREEVVKLMLKSGAAINIRNSYLTTPVMMAAYGGNTAIMQLLIQFGARINSNIKEQEMLPNPQKNEEIFSLFQAVRTGDIAKLIELLDSNVDPNVEDIAGESPLSLSIRSGYAEMVILLIRARADVNTVTKAGRSPLMDAVNQNQIEIVKILLEHDADPDLSCLRGCTAISIAAFQNNVPCLELLLQSGARSDSKDKEGKTPLMLAGMNGHFNAFQILLKSGAQINTKVLLVEAAAKGYTSIVQTILDQKGKIDKKEFWLEGALIRAAGNGHNAVVQLILYMINPNFKNALGKIPIIEAAKGGHQMIVTTLLANGAYINIRDDKEETALHHAVRIGEHSELIGLLIKSGAGVNISNIEGRTPLALAASEGHIGISCCLIESGAGIDIVDKFGNTPLCLAASKGNLGVVKILIKRGADILVTNRKDKDALQLAKENSHDHIAEYLEQHLKDRYQENDNIFQARLDLIAAICSNDQAAVKKLIAGKVNLNFLDNDGESALSFAAKNGYYVIVKMLLEAGADVNLTNRDGSTALLNAIYQDRHEVITLLLKHHADANLADLNGVTPIVIAACLGLTHIVKMLLNNNACLKEISKKSVSPLICAITNQSIGQIEVVRLLLEHNAPVDYPSVTGNTALILAADKGNIEVVKILLEYGADIGKENGEGYSAFMAATTNGHIEIVKLFIGRHADVNRSSPLRANTTPLMEAALKNHKDIVKLLLQHHADVDSSNDKGLTALSFADDPEIIKLLLEAGAYIDKQNMNGVTALFNAAASGKFEKVKFLLENMAGVDIKNTAGETPLILSASIEIMKLLLEHGADISKVDNKGFTSLVWAKLELKKNVLEVLREHNDGFEESLKAKEVLRVLSVAHCCHLSGKVALQPISGGPPLFEVVLSGAIMGYWLKKMAKVTQLQSQRGILRQKESQELEKLLASGINKDTKSLIESIQNGFQVLLHTGFLKHGVAVLIWAPYFIICNRGEESRGKPIEVFRYDPIFFDEATIVSILDIKTQEANGFKKLFFETLPSKLKFEQGEFEKKLEDACKLPDQTVGNCSWTSAEAAVWAFLMLGALKKGCDGRLNSDKILNKDVFNTIVEAKYNKFSAWVYFNQIYHLERYLGVRCLRPNSDEKKVERSMMNRKIYQLDTFLLEEATKKIEEFYSILDKKYAHLINFFTIITGKKT